MPKMVEISKESQICLAQHFATLYQQSANEEIADFGIPCSKCKIFSICRGDWLGQLDSVFEQTGIKLSSRSTKDKKASNEDSSGTEPIVPEREAQMGNGSSYIIYIADSYEKATALHKPMLSLKNTHTGWYWHVSTVQVLQDCRIPPMYHGEDTYATIIEHNNGGWHQPKTYEIHQL